ncbi:MAG: cytochrome b/b6 domain-containing protein [Nitrososphaerota archaeon]|nr:cytochrome b/b6 domain-containing protein [Nitrososphaerota archaeon]
MIGSISLQVAPVFRLPVAYGAIIVLLFVAMAVIHFARRAYRQPVKEIAAPIGTEPTEGTVKAFDIVERIYHWSLFVVTGLLVLTGISLFAPGVFDALLAAFGVTSTAGLLMWHTDMVWALLGLLVIHIVWDVAVTRGWSNIWIGVKDIRDTGVRAKNFFGMTRKYSKPGKYDIFMKTLHWGMAVSIVILGATGIFMMNPYGLLYAVSPAIDNLFRILHDVFAFLFIGLVIGHIYFAVIPVNWPVLKAIFTGNITQEAYIKEYDSQRWRLKQEKPKAPAKPKEAAPVPISKAVDVDASIQVDQSAKKLVGE